MAIEMTAGHHDFALTYETPNLRLGAALTLVGLALIAGIALFNRRRPSSRKSADAS